MDEFILKQTVTEYISETTAKVAEASSTSVQYAESVIAEKMDIEHRPEKKLEAIKIA